MEGSGCAGSRASRSEPVLTGQGQERIAPRSAIGLGALILATFVAITTEVVPIGVLPQIVREYDVSTSIAGLLVTVFAALVALLALPLTSATERLPRKPLLLVTIVLYAVANLIIALAPSFAVVCAGRVVGGVAHAVFFSISTAYAAALVPPRKQGQAIAIGLSGASAGYLLGVPLVTRLGADLGQRVAFGSLSAAAVVVALAVAVALPGIPTVVRASFPRSPVPSRALVSVASANLLAFFAHYALYTYVSALLIGSGLPESSLAAALLVVGAGGVVGLVVAGFVVDRRPRAGLVTALAVATACVAAIGVLGTSVVAVIVAAALWSAAFGAMPTFFATGSLRTGVLPPDLSAAVNNMVSNIGIGLGAAVGGGVVALGGIGAATLLCLVLFAAALVLVPLSRRGFPARPSY